MIDVVLFYIFFYDSGAGTDFKIIIYKQKYFINIINVKKGINPSQLQQKLVLK